MLRLLKKCRFNKALYYCQKFLKTSRAKKLLILEACFFLGLARLAIIFLSFKKIASYLGELNQETAWIEEIVFLKEIAWAVNGIALFTPWKSNCLTRAIATAIMLKKRGISYSIYLGVARDEINQLTAHAWLRSGKTYLTGGENRDKFTVTGILGYQGK